MNRQLTIQSGGCLIDPLQYSTENMILPALFSELKPAPPVPSLQAPNS
jgi:hypothetical protein